MQLVQAPERFDVLVMPNLYGDVVAELGAGLIGGRRRGAGRAASAATARAAVFEATHGTGAAISRAPIGANPVGVMLCRGDARCATSASARPATVSRRRWRRCSPTGRAVTYDLRALATIDRGGHASAVADAVIDRLGRRWRRSMATGRR